MNLKQARKLGFWAALALLIGSVIGIGIFFRNHGVTRIHHENGVGVLISWIIGAFLAFFAAISFSEIGALKNGKLQGFSGWANRVGGSKFGYLVRFLYSAYYYPSSVLSIGLFSSQFLFIFLNSVEKLATNNAQANLLASNTVPIYAQVLVALAFIIVLMLAQFLTTKGSSYFQILTTFLKFIPLVVVVIVGCFLIKNNYLTAAYLKENQLTLAKVGKNGFLIGEVNAASVFLALPAVLFTFDAFLVVTSLTNKIKGGGKTISKVVIVGMTIIIIFYLLVTIAAILNNQGALQNVLINRLGVQNTLALLVFFNLFIFISSIGLLNALIFGIIGEVANGLETNLYFGAKPLINKLQLKNSKRLYVFLFLLFWGFIMYLPSLILNTDKVADAISLLPTVIFFILYISVTSLYLKSRKNYSEIKKINNLLITVSVIVFTLGTVIAISGFYINVIVEAIKIPREDSFFGLFGPEDKLAKIDKVGRAYIVFIVSATALVLPLINYGLFKLFNKKDTPLVVQDITKH